jgi:hypothetical protein
MQFLKITALCVASAIAYGILHDNVTARVCVEYFTIGHPPIFRTESPTVLAFGWGILATWWVGLGLGLPLAIVARAGRGPKLTVRDVRRPIAILLVVMGIVSLAAGIAGSFAAQAGAVWLNDDLAARVPAEKHVRFLADLWAHLAAYGVGFAGGLVVMAWAWGRRRWLAGWAAAVEQLAAGLGAVEN